jgi:hypothetical protein
MSILFVPDAERIDQGTPETCREQNQAWLVLGKRLVRLFGSSWGVGPMDFHSGGDADPAGKTENLLGSDNGARQVSHDMEGIFGAAKSRNGEASSQSRAIVPIVARPPDGRTKRSAIGRTLPPPGVLIAGALAVSIVLSIVLAEHGAPSSSSRPIAKPLPPLASQVAQVERPPILARPQAAPAAPAGIASKHATETSAAEKSRRKPKPVTDRQAPKSTQRLAVKPATREPQTHTRAQHLAMKPATSAPRSHGRAQRLAMKPATSAPRSQIGLACDRLSGLDLARCMRPQVIDADQKLRNAYNDAIRAGVDRRVLVAYRRQWSKLRNHANSDPRSVVVGYRQIAQHLDAARTGRLAGAF